MQIQLSEDQRRHLERWAHERGISISEAVRRCVDERLHRDAQAPPRERQVRDALAVCGRYADPRRATRIAERHDEHLADAFSD